MVWKPESCRIVLKFALLPRKMSDGHTVFLKTYYLVQVYDAGTRAWYTVVKTDDVVLAKLEHDEREAQYGKPVSW